METKIVRSDSEQSRANEMFNSLRDELLKRDLSNTENYDKSILTLSSTSLGLSITAIKFIIPLATAEKIWLLKLGWILLLASIITSILAFLLSNKAIKVQLQNAEDYYVNCITEAFNRTNIYIKVNSILNYATGLMFVIAITAIVAFIILNITSKVDNMSKKSSTESTIGIAQESANIPSIQGVLTDLDADFTNSANIPTMQQAPETQTTSQSSETDGSSDKSE